MFLFSFRRLFGRKSRLRYSGWAENEPCKVCSLSVYRSPRCANDPFFRLASPSLVLRSSPHLLNFSKRRWKFLQNRIEFLHWLLVQLFWISSISDIILWKNLSVFEKWRMWPTIWKTFNTSLTKVWRKFANFRAIKKCIKKTAKEKVC